MITHVDVAETGIELLCRPNEPIKMLGIHQDAFWWPREELNTMSNETAATITCPKCRRIVEDAWRGTELQGARMSAQ